MSLLRRNRSARRPGQTVSQPDTRIWGRDYRGPSPWVVGLLFLVIIGIASFLAYTKRIPFTDRGYELQATFENAATIRTNSPVRIAGVNVGKVISIEGKGDAAEVTFTVSDEGQPVHDDAEVTVRPRLFLEGNFFLDVRPGSPSAPELPDGADIPVTQTATAVQLDEILTSLQSDSRANLKKLLIGYGEALNYQPTADDDLTQDPDVAGESGGEAINDSFAYGGRAGKGTAIVNEALLGHEPHDLSRLIEGQRRTFSELASVDSDLQGLITNFNVFTGALAAEQSNLSATIRELAPTVEEAEPSLRHLNEALPPLRAFALELEPSIRELPGTITAAGPWLTQTKKLLRDPELGSLAKQLAATQPGLGETSRQALRLFPELTNLSLCATDVLNPTGETAITADPLNPGNTTPNFNEFLYGMADFAGQGASFDGNGIFLRAQAGGGPQLVKTNNPEPIPQNSLLFGNTTEPLTGTQPRTPTTLIPDFRMDVPCADNPPPDVNGPAAAVAPPTPVVAP